MHTKQIIVGSAILVVCGAALYTLGAFKGLVAIAGAMFAAAVMAWPMLGLICVILAGTCFQIVGSSELIIALVLSFTRSGFLGLMFAMAYLLYRRCLPILPLALCGILAVATSPVWLPPGFVERIFSTKYLREGSTPARRELVKDGIDAFLEKPFWGHGYGQFGYFYFRQIQTRPRTEWSNEVEDSVNRGKEVPENIGVHNLYLEVGVEYGLAGLIPFLLIMVFARKDLGLVEAIGGNDDRELAICLTSCLLCFAICGVFGHLKILKVLWIMLGLSAALRSVALNDANQRTTSAQGIT